jgi:hypothetical protein
LTEAAKDEASWIFAFGCGVSIRVECHWRLIVGGIAVSDEDHGQLFGLKVPVDAAQVVFERVGESPVAEVMLRGGPSDMLLHFANGAILEILPNSSGHENWALRGPDGWVMLAAGGGNLVSYKLGD